MNSTKTFEFHFKAKIKNSIGLSQEFTKKASGNGWEDALLNLYKFYDHIQVLDFKEIVNDNE